MRHSIIGALLAMTALIAGCGGSASSSTLLAPTIKVLSNRADLISGGNALIEVTPPPGVNPATLRESVGATDVTSMFAVRPNGRYMGLVTGLATGPNVLTASAGDGASSSITITNYPAGGPIIYGPQVQPWSCDAGSVDSQCNRPAVFSYKYISTNANLVGFQVYDPDHPAADVAFTTTDQGQSVPFIVRIETGVQDRDYYNIAVLFDPTKPWAPWSPQAGWNQKLMVMHGAGCGMGYAQYNGLAGRSILDQYALSHGFAVMSVALNDSGHNCNLAVQAEAMMMAKQHLIETYGEVLYTVGWGQSGGALAEQWIANAYPGIYDGIIVGMAFPDAGSTLLETEDCALLRNYFSGPGSTWTPAEQAAAAGHPNTPGVGDAVCQNWVDLFGFNKALNPALGLTPVDPIITAATGTSPTALGGCDAPAPLIFSSQNITGVRCDLQDYMVSIVGRRQVDGYANRAYSNTGIQYGLSALISGQITQDQFISLNAKIGSHDINYTYQQSRAVADADALAASYRSGLVNEANGMASVAIIQIRGIDTTTIHHQYRAWSIQARLDRANGGHGNMALWYNAGSQDEAYDAMDKWLSAVKADTSSQSLSQKIVADRPAQAGDRCGSQSGTGLTMQQCSGIADGSVRMAAGEDIHDDIIECQLTPLNRLSYSVPFTDAQWVQLQAIFPNGVCDWTKSGSGQQSTQPWQTYLKPDGTVVVGGAPLPPAPAGSPTSQY